MRVMCLRQLLALFLLLWLHKALGQQASMLQKLHDGINTHYDETNPILSEDGRTLYFTRVGHPYFDKTLRVDETDLSTTLTHEQYRERLSEVFYQLGDSPGQDPLSSPFNQDVWIAQSAQGQFDQIEHPKYPLNSALPNSVCAITTDPSTVVVVNQFFQDGSMQKGFSFARRINGNWVFPEPLHIYDYHNIDAGVNLTLSRDNEVMILSLSRPGGQGEHDLYAAFRVHTSLWSAPVHLGPTINTGYREITPFLTDDKRFLLFASDRPNQNGGHNIYISQRLDDSWCNWSVPQPLPAPINSAYDDAQPFYHQRSGYLYFASTRDGSSDIFRCRYPISLTTSYEEPLAAIVTKPKQSESGAANRFLFLVKDTDSGQPIEAFLSYGLGDEADDKKTVVVGKGGYWIDAPEDLSIFAEVTRKNYLPAVRHIAGQSGSRQDTVWIDIDPIKVDSRITMQAIQFVRSSDQILETSHAELERLANLLKLHPSLQITILGHTDSVGDAWALYQLSQSRAVAIKRFLVKAGIQSFRIATKGMGPSQPITDNSSEELRAINRRVEVLITKT